MKTMILVALLAVGVTAKAEQYSYNCSFQSMSTYQGTQTTVLLTCDNGFGEMKLLGSNNSPCEAATHLEDFFTGATPSEAVQIIAVSGQASGYGGVEDYFNVLSAKRANSHALLEAPTVLAHGKPVRCNNTHVSIYRR